MQYRRLTQACYFAAGIGAITIAVCYWLPFLTGSRVAVSLHHFLVFSLMLTPHGIIAVSAWLGRPYRWSLMAVLSVSVVVNLCAVGFLFKSVPSGWPFKFGVGEAMSIGLLPIFQAVCSIFALGIGMTAALLSDYKVQE
jgi:hypothetical protein